MAEGQNHLPGPAGHSSFHVAQDMIVFLGCEPTLLGHFGVSSTSTPESSAKLL